WVLGEFGLEAQGALPALTKVLNDEVDDVRMFAAEALEKIAGALRETCRTDAVVQLKEAERALEQSTESRVKAYMTGVEEAVHALETMCQNSVKDRLLRLIHALPWVVL